MVRLNNFIYCLNTERIFNERREENINAVGVLTALVPEFVPGAFSFAIIFSVLGIDLSQNNNIQITFSKDGDKEPMVDSGVVVLPPDKGDSGLGLPDEYKGVVMSMDFRNVIFETEGVYNTAVFINGQLLANNPVYVKGKR